MAKKKIFKLTILDGQTHDIIAQTDNVDIEAIEQAYKEIKDKDSGAV